MEELWPAVPERKDGDLVSVVPAGLLFELRDRAAASQVRRVSIPRSQVAAEVPDHRILDYGSIDTP